MTKRRVLSVNIERTDLRDRDAVIKLGRQFGEHWMEQLQDLVLAIDPELRCWFFPALLAPVAGHMVASTNHEAALTMVDALRQVILNRVAESAQGEVKH